MAKGSSSAASSSPGPTLTAVFAATERWDGGYSGAYTVRNAGETSRRGWRLEFDLPAGARVTSVWDGMASARTGHITVAPQPWNTDLPAGGSVTVGLVVTHSAGLGALPTRCLLDGGSCAGSGATPTRVTASSTAPNRTVPQSPATSSTSTSTGTGASLAACQHFSAEVPPSRVTGPSRNATSQAPRIDLSDHLPAPATVTGKLSGGAVRISLSRVPGATAYRVWRNGQSVGWLDDWGQETLTVTDPLPCQGAYYTVAALRNDASAASTGQLSTPYRLGDDGSVRAAPLAAGTTMTLRVTAYGDAGQTASGLAAGPGTCAVDARRIPWGTRLKVDGYGYCYAADIGTWIQGDIVDVWMPNADAANWGVQSRTVTVVDAA
ncbi:MAG: hypothetical protein QG622_255 [Actinomycetota bacterium]|nr:hypothetical protein [Actinomycetota bacterium]